MNTNGTLKDFYENYDEDSRLLSRYGYVEYITTMKYIEMYLKPGMRILEIGAATGRYSHALARKGYKVDAIELVEHNIEIFKKNTQESEDVTITQGNAINLSAFKDNTYDITLILGPLYHLYTEEDKSQALKEAVRVTKKGGVIFAAYCMGDSAILLYGFQKNEIHNIISKCKINIDTFDSFSEPWDVFELHRKENIEALRSKLNVEHLHLLATDGYANHMREKLETMDEETYNLFLKYHLATCERQDMIGYSNHTLDIFRKE